ncbi:hypothetical protein EUTSA_v10005271mg [Eutrema salsugineum]|uniref:Uncharacterized protein n=1 Tax=Eutrema salsugineum TaxID=72664 RepID=V4KNQ0_EUTSA|nr:zinc transporter 7 [Eutrema salsugineum]ESQ32944.1 hypothetical protein EUTSA_v10005271mg [Eutrema salsugineum]
MAFSKSYYNLLTITILLLSSTSTSLAGNAENADVSECKAESGDSSCRNNIESQKLKLIAIPSILVASMIGVCLPLFTRSIPALGPDRDTFPIVKGLSSGVILATGYMHVFPDAVENLTSKCLPESPWREFPFTFFIAMVSALVTLMVDSFLMSAHKKRASKREVKVKPLENGSNSLEIQHEIKTLENGSVVVEKQDEVTSQLRRNKVIAQMLELGIVVHSVVIGLAMGASNNQCTIRSLIAALCFHQLFEGMGLGGSILQAEYGRQTRLIMAFFFSVTTPFGIALGMGIQKIYDETSPTALIVVGVLNACSAGLLNYMALVDLLAHEFFGEKLQANMKLQSFAYVAVLIGLGGMSLMAKWA